MSSVCQNVIEHKVGCLMWSLAMYHVPARRLVFPAIPSYSAYDKTFYRQRHRIENMFGRLKTGHDCHS